MPRWVRNDPEADLFLAASDIISDFMHVRKGCARPVSRKTPTPLAFLRKCLDHWRCERDFGGITAPADTRNLCSCRVQCIKLRQGEQRGAKTREAESVLQRTTPHCYVPPGRETKHP